MFRSSDTRSLFHDHSRGHHGPSFFGMALARLRPALYYFTLAVVITIFFYCLLFYDPESSRHHPHRRFRAHYGQASALISSPGGSRNDAEDGTTGAGHISAAFLLEEFIRNANLHFADNYARKIPLVPTLLESDGLVGSGDSSSQTQPDDSQHHQRSLLENLRYDVAQQQAANTTSANNTLITDEAGDGSVRIHLLGEDDDLAEEDEDYLALVDEPDSIEHYLETLGFNIRHITRYLLHANQSANNGTKRSARKIASSKAANNQLDASKSPPSPSPSSPLQPPTQSNISSASDILDLLSGIDSSDYNNTLIFVSAINSNQFSMAYRFIRSFERYRQMNAKSPAQSRMHLRLMLYDLGLGEDQLFELQTLCNRTWEHSVSTLCKFRKFNYTHYPSHVSDLKIAAYRSIILQEMLRDIRRARRHLLTLHSGVADTAAPTTTSTFSLRASKGEQIYSILWLDPHYRFLPGTIFRHPLLLPQLLSETRNISGLRSWSIEAPTSALTHPRMFEYFHTTADNFYFHRMVRSSHLVISISESTWQPFELGIMLAWVRCALTEGCIVPLGSQWRSSCRLDKKPHYRYSGCHHYDMSALNVVLGIAYNYSSSEYSAPPSSRFFAPFYKLLKASQATSSTGGALDTSNDNQHESVAKLTDEDFDYPDYDPSHSVRYDESLLLESEDRFDRILSDDDLPEEQRRPAPKRPSASSLTLSSPSKLFHQSASLLAPLSALSSTSPEDESLHSLNTL